MNRNRGVIITFMITNILICTIDPLILLFLLVFLRAILFSSKITIFIRVLPPSRDDLFFQASRYGLLKLVDVIIRQGTIDVSFFKLFCFNLQAFYVIQIDSK